ncbi:MAG TPA: DUF4253 domain-containing protein [Actinoplanes sp.]|nr:DUF4253 domain-containing protein [Actinoplanes sp.]
MRALTLDTDPVDGRWAVAQELLWISDGPPQPGWWQVLRAQHHRSGLWPLLLGAISERDPGRPWLDEGDLFPEQVRSAPGDHYPGVLLGGWWASVEKDEPWTGLAHRGEITTDPDEHAAATADLLLEFDWLASPRLGLVPAGRGADTLAAVAWSGPLNHESDTARISCVIRSWEDRFGARVLGAGFATLFLSVAGPPTTLAHARHLATEHMAFCPDNIWQGAGSLDAYAESLVGAPMWSFWWD